MRVSEIFDTLSGEAPTIGEPATFVRLFGCSVKCQTCDTLYSVFKPTISYMKGYLKGLGAGDGHFSKAGTLDIGMNDLEAIEQTVEFWMKVFPVSHRPNIAKKVRGSWAFKPGGIYYRVVMSRKKFVAELQLPPQNREERRGFVGGFFDAEGSCGKPGKRNKKWTLEFSNGETDLLDIVAEGLDDWRFRYTRGSPHNKRMGRVLHQLRVVSFAQSAHGLSPSEKKIRWEAEAQRFFDTYRPSITRKYGPWLRRWESQTLTADEITKLCKMHLVVISGGEPLEQNLDELIIALRNAGHQIQVETSGAFEFKGEERPDILVCSPKPNAKYRISPTVMESASIFKLVNGPERSGFEWNQPLADQLQEMGKRIFVMPYGGPPSKVAVESTVNLAKTYGYTYSPRLHYDLGVR